MHHVCIFVKWKVKLEERIVRVSIREIFSDVSLCLLRPLQVDMCIEHSYYELLHIYAMHNLFLKLMNDINYT
jgi:hypothetical protein